MDARVIRLAGWTRTAAGWWLMVRGPAVAGDLTPPPVPVVLPLAARALGLRDVVQGVVLLRRPGGRWVVVGALLDGVHVASMLALACSSVKYRRVALVASGEATLALLASLSALRPAVPGSRDVRNLTPSS